jgi:hypothetical protein
MAKSKQLHEDLNPYKYEFSHEEMEILGMRLAGLVDQVKSVKDSKAAIAASYGAQIKELQEEMGLVAKNIRDGFEMREPEQGQIVFKGGSRPEEGLTEEEADRLANEQVATE